MAVRGGVQLGGVASTSMCLEIRVLRGGAGRVSARIFRLNRRAYHFCKDFMPSANQTDSESPDIARGEIKKLITRGHKDTLPVLTTGRWARSWDRQGLASPTLILRYDAQETGLRIDAHG